MKNFFYSVLALFIFFCSNHGFTNEDYNINSKNYIYDDHGDPLFIKIYIDTLRAKPANQNENVVLVSLQKRDLQMLNLMTQIDHRGSYVAIPIKKKKNNNDDEDASIWVCPICLRENPAYRNTCQWPDCPLSRKGIREQGGW